MKFSKILFSACLGLAALATSLHAQVVPLRIHGSFIGNMETATAYGQAVGAPFGQCTFVITNVSNPNGGTATYDTYTAADGSTLTMIRVGLTFTITPVPGAPNLVYINGIDRWQIVGGTGRFANASSAGDPIVSTFWTPNPFDLTGDVTAIPALYHKNGQINLGRRN